MTSPMTHTAPTVYKVAVVIPCYRVQDQILSVLKKIGDEITHIYCIDDACPEGSSKHIEKHFKDPRVKILSHAFNQGVGAAVMSGYRAALKDNVDIIVKLDGDGQMDPQFIPKLIAPILAGHADYTKANRFFNLEFLENMPFIRKVGNACLSFMNKFSTGYWDIFDPTNGFTAIHGRVLQELNLNKIAKRYFFENDLLFRLNIIRAVVKDIPHPAKYGSEESNLKIRSVFWNFLFGHSRNFIKRIFYNYFLRNFTLGSLEIICAALLLPYGLYKGLSEWSLSISTGNVASAGTVMLAALPIILGFQMLLSFFNQDLQNIPKMPIHPYLKKIEESEL